MVKKKKSGRKKKVAVKKRVIILFLILLFGIAYLLTHFSLVVVSGLSMYPTLHSNDLLLIKSTDYEDLKRGDIIVFTSDITHEDLVKRVIAKENETVEITEQGVSVNNKAPTLDYDYSTKKKGYQPQEKQTVGKNKIYVLGDNRADSIDSRDARVGQIGKSSIRGKVILNISNKVGMSLNRIIVVCLETFFAILAVLIIFRIAYILTKKK